MSTHGRQIPSGSRPALIARAEAGERTLAHTATARRLVEAPADMDYIPAVHRMGCVADGLSASLMVAYLRIVDGDCSLE
jgi:hypothetical protein